MKKLLAIVAVLCSLSAGWAKTVLAQQAEDKGVPVEFFGCTYQDGKGLADLTKVADKFSKWSDKNDSGYSAWILTPQFATNLGLDVGWLGAWPSGEAMGKGMDLSGSEKKEKK